MARLSRSTANLPAFPVRTVHLGLGAFHRAHQAWYAHAAGDERGIAAFTGRRPDAAVPLAEQDGLYTLLVRGAGGDEAEIIRSISAAHDGADIAALTGYLADPAVSVVTLTITEAGYHRGPDGTIDRTAAAGDIEALRNGGTPGTAPGRLLAGLAARRNADSGPIAVVPCDNLSGNGEATSAVLASLAEAVDPALAVWVKETVSFVSTMVDRITPATTDEDRATAGRLTGFQDHSPVVTEPFTEWLLADAFPGLRPTWDAAGARFVTDVTPFETRKLWLLNGAHSTLAYAGPTRGHRTVAEAVGDQVCRDWMDEWWDEAARHLTIPAGEISAYRAALLDRFANPRIQHLLAQIAADGSQKLTFRIVPVVRAERAAGRLPGGGVRALAAWLVHLRDGSAVRDPRAAELAGLIAGPLADAAPRTLAVLDSELAADADLVAAVIDAAGELGWK
ncbi:MAG TPA: mannitol dehydrogenase family protein [Mycobacteriales bacterium]|jgi:fructuronate reductase|nr:mannitol dehydrogenase family protein [Mycobacteriales bacterium]